MAQRITMIVASCALSSANGQVMTASEELSHWQRRCGSELTKEPLLPVRAGRMLASDIPAEFDARTQWPQCPSIGRIRDQSECGSCWAISSTEAFNDRHCISSGDGDLTLSAADTMECASGSGCGGGQPANAWSFFASEGVVTGGSYETMGSGQTCKPYPFAECAHHVESAKYPACPGSDYPTPTCSQTCTDTGYPKDYASDKVRLHSAYALLGESSIQGEIMTMGPTTAIFDVMGTYPLNEFSFPMYKHGVYAHGGSDMKLGGHAVKIIGWGLGHTACYAIGASAGDVWCARNCGAGNCPSTLCRCDDSPPDQGTVPYWLVVNSWNEEWGEGGTFKILRGANECGIETNVYAGAFAEDAIV